jgi:pimeloyl-ACP methyl ester carboxylesterase
VALVALSLTLAACSPGTRHPSTPPSTPQSGTPVASSTPATSGAATTGAPLPASITFSNCSGQFQAAIGGGRAEQIQFSCGKLAVPLDYGRPAGTKIQIFVLRVHLKSQRPADKLGSLLVNPGGPGSSGVNLAAGLVNELSETILQHFDLIGFDPRGVGLSQPVSCISDKVKDALAAADPDVRTAAGRSAARASASSVLRSCVGRYGATLAHFNTAETAQDMDLIRRAVGDSKLNYLGYSYGSRLGTAYAHEFPGTIRTEVLDGPEDPATDLVTYTALQARAFESAFDEFAANCLTRPTCAVLGNPRAAVTRLIVSADRTPIGAGGRPDPRRATGGIVTLAVLAGLYNQSSWAGLGNALVQAEHGDAAGLFALSDSYLQRDPATGRYSNIMDANLAVTCNDSDVRITDALVADAARRWSAEYPIFGRSFAAGLYNCYGWPDSGHALPPGSAPGAPPILVIGTVHDPATPYSQAAVLARALGSGVVLTWNGEGHTAYPKTGCIRSKVDSYLLTATPPAELGCPSS